MTNLHEHYDQLTDNERGFVDEATQNIFKHAKVPPISLFLAGDDRAERFVDAFAKWILESRKA